MTAYFPKPRPDEVLYSVLARLGRHLRCPGVGDVARLAFGDRFAVATLDVPTRLRELCRRLPEGIAATPGEIADRLTILPYHLAFRSPAEGRALRRASAGAGALHLRLGLAASAAERVGVLRFCLQCEAAALARFGERFWRRCHQLPGVYFCPDHAAPLRLSLVDLARCSRHAFVPADGAVCPPGSPVALGGLRDAAEDRLVLLSRASAALLREGRRPSCDPSARDYRRALGEVGLMRSEMKVDVRGLRHALEGFWGEALSVLPGVTSPDGRCGPWLESIVRPHRKAPHPIHHLLLGCYLGKRAKEEGPFGGGPRCCENLPVLHGGRDVVTRAQVEGDSDAASGEFSCTCAGVPLYAASKVVPPVPGQLPEAAAPAPGRKPRRNWAAVDLETAFRVPAARSEIISVVPPQRVTFAALEREACGGANALRRRRDKLPRTWAAVLAALEGDAAFMERRIRFAIGALRRQGVDPQAWRIMRSAGVTGRHRRLVESVLSAARCEAPSAEAA